MSPSSHDTASCNHAHDAPSAPHPPASSPFPRRPWYPLPRPRPMSLSFSLPPRTPPTCTAARARSGPALLLSSAFSAVSCAVCVVLFCRRASLCVGCRSCVFVVARSSCLCFLPFASLLPRRCCCFLAFRCRCCLLLFRCGGVRARAFCRLWLGAQAASTRPFDTPKPLLLMYCRRPMPQRHRHHIASHAARICRCSAHFTISRCKHPRRCSCSSAASPHNAQSARAVPPFSSPSMPPWVLLLGRVVCCFVVPG
jgi:hypothetical protein